MSRKTGICAAVTGFFLLLSVFHHWEPSETWGYWAFSRILWETGEFIIPDRSPAYVTYLLLFRWLPFPVSIATEYFVTTGITVAALIVFFRPLLGLGMATFAVILWIPFLQIAEPPPQKLALALSLFAVMLRNKRPSPFRISSSYALLILCYLLRSTYQFFLLVFLVWDITTWITKKLKKISPLTIRGVGGVMSRHGQDSLRATRGIVRHIIQAVRTHSVFFIVLSFYLLILLWQSPHPWNTIYFSTTQWFPHDGKHFSILQIYNARYAYETYGTIKDHDFYFTNQEVFHGAKSNLEAVFANPGFVLRILAHQLVDGIFEMTRLTLAYAAIVSVPDDWAMYIQSLFVLVLGALFYGAFRGGSTASIRLMVVGNILMAFLSMVILPHWRYMLPLIPVFLLGIVWYAKKMGGLVYLHKSCAVKTNILARCFTASLIIAFCSSVVLWKNLLVHVFVDTIHADLRVFHSSEEEYGSLTAAIPQLQTLSRQCRGIMLLEHTALAGFSYIPLAHIHDVFSLPPFGRYEASDVSVLHPDRVNCLFISRQASQDIGYGTNIQMRYERYLAPYKEALLQRGAQAIPVESYGEFIIAP